MSEPIQTENTEQAQEKEARMNPDALYREEIYTDRKIGVIRALIPIKISGEFDDTRTTLYTGEGQIMTQMGPLPISFEIPAQNLAEAVEKYGEAAKKGVQETIEKLQELRRQEASKLVVPGQPGFSAPQGSGIVMP